MILSHASMLTLYSLLVLGLLTAGVRVTAAQPAVPTTSETRRDEPLPLGGLSSPLLAMMKSSHQDTSSPPLVSDISLEEALRRICPPGGSDVNCYVRLATLIHNPAARGALVRRLWHVCPADGDHFRCFFAYLNLILGRRPQRAAAADAGGGRKRAMSATWRLCPESMDTIACFDSYLALWLQLVTSQGGKRTFGPGRKRSTDSGGQWQRRRRRSADNAAADDDDVDDDGDAPEALAARSMSSSAQASPGSSMRRALGNDGDCASSDGKGRNNNACQGRRQVGRLSGQKPRRERRYLGGQLPLLPLKRNLESVCHDQDPMTCFQHYLTQLVMYENNKQRVKGFVGKRAPPAATPYEADNEEGA